MPKSLNRAQHDQSVKPRLVDNEITLTAEQVDHFHAEGLLLNNPEGQLIAVVCSDDLDTVEDKENRTDAKCLVRLIQQGILTRPDGLELDTEAVAGLQYVMSEINTLVE